jgi:dTDP-4-dehydrorhamnose reductase
LTAQKKEAFGVCRSGRDGADACELSDPGAVRCLMDARKPSVIVHAAAFSDVDGCERAPAEAHRSNALAVKALSAYAAETETPLVAVSTDYVFDGHKRAPYTEDDATGPVNAYGITKLAGEFYARSAPYAAVVRTSWLFGPGNPRNFVNVIAARLATEKEVAVLADQTGSPTYSVDLAACLEQIGEWLMGRKREGVRCAEIFQISNGGATTRLEMAEAIRERLGFGGVTVRRADPSGVQGRLAVRPAYSVMSSAKYEKAFGAKMRPWRESLAEYLAKGAGP